MHGERKEKPGDPGKPAQGSEIETLLFIEYMGGFFIANNLKFCVSKKRKLGNGMEGGDILRLLTNVGQVILPLFALLEAL